MPERFPPAMCYSAIVTEDHAYGRRLLLWFQVFLNSTGLTGPGSQSCFMAMTTIFGSKLFRTWLYLCWNQQVFYNYDTEINYGLQILWMPTIPQYRLYGCQGTTSVDITAHCTMIRITDTPVGDLHFISTGCLFQIIYRRDDGMQRLL